MNSLLNVASWDRILRVVVGAMLAYAGFSSLIAGALGVVLGILGLVFVITGVVGFCPLYALFKFQTLHRAGGSHS